jgi:hypothetical protein
VFSPYFSRRRPTPASVHSRLVGFSPASPASVVACRTPAPSPNALVVVVVRYVSTFRDFEVLLFQLLYTIVISPFTFHTHRAFLIHHLPSTPTPFVIST